MGKGYEVHQARILALQSLGKDLARRAKSKCEITGQGGVPLRPYEVPPVTAEPDLEHTLLLCEAVHAVLEKPSTLAGRSWQSPLSEIVWSDMPAVQVVAWRMLNHLAKKEDWARDVVEEVFLDEGVEEWARAAEL